MKMWDKGKASDRRVLGFTAGRDRELDMKLAVWDIIGSMAHTVMLYESGLIAAQEKEIIIEALASLYSKAEKGTLDIGEGYEDIHSRIESDLTVNSGDAGRKIHAGRSRNDQVLTDIYLFLRDEVALISSDVFRLLKAFTHLSKDHSEVMMPGYTHLQPAMPSSFGLWFGAYAESLCDDLEALRYAMDAVNVSPAGTAAGYGTTLPLKREVMAELLRFDRLVINSAYAQLRRGKAEKAVADAISSVAFTLSRFSGDICLFMSQEFSFLSFRDDLTTGSSIMPQKKNPDVFEIIRARANILRALPNSLSMLATNLPPGYNRDFQVIKEVLFPAIEEIKSITAMAAFMLDGLIVRHNIIDESYNSIFSAEAANRMVMQGIPFRDAYRSVAEGVGKKLFSETRPADYTHLGSPGNTGTGEILKRAEGIMENLKTISAAELISAIRMA